MRLSVGNKDTGRLEIKTNGRPSGVLAFAKTGGKHYDKQAHFQKDVHLDPILIFLY